ncbi:MAG: hypothetical protein ACI9VN_001084 [Patescibacteria group bacterium]|jgi:hypothetical protein
MMHCKTVLFGLLGLLLSLTSFANSGAAAFKSSNQPPDCSLVSNQINNMIYLGEYNNSKYYCSNTSNFTWHQAKSAAESSGGHLLIINNAAENEYIRSNIQADYVWLGLTDEDSEGNFKTVQGLSPSYTYWETGEPNNDNGNEHYVRLLKSNGKWTDRTASFEAEYVLEIPCPDPNNPPPPTVPICTTRTASNVVNCNNDETYAGWLKVEGEDFYYSISNGELIEYTNGTATYTARWANNEQSNIVFDIDITLTGKTETAPNSPKPHSCLNPNTNNFYYYQDFSGTLKGKQLIDGAVINISSYGTAPQLGVGANATGTANAFGMSTSFTGFITQQPNSGGDISLDANSGGHVGDINIKLSGGADDCENCADSDNDGTCNVDDCAPNNPNIPANPGTSCNDNNSNTINDVIQADGCTCAGNSGPNQNGSIKVTVQSDQGICPGETVTLTATYTDESSCQTPCGFGNGSNAQQIAKWDLEDCASFSGDGSNSDYSEMTSSTNGLSCASVTASGLYRFDGNHSCTDDAGNEDPGDAVCLGMPDINNFVDNHPKALRFDISIDPSNGNSGITKLTFKEFAPSTFIWSQTGYTSSTGPNNYPTKYGIRVLKNGVEIFKQTNLNTSTNNWSMRTFDFSSDINFQSDDIALYSFELLAYDQIGNGADISAWDIDDIRAFGDCCATQSNNTVTYLWSNSATTPSITIQPGATTTYTVTVTDCVGDTDSDNATVTVTDADNDGICDNEDCEPNNPMLPTTVGSACDDNNSYTINDIIQADSCTCLGTDIVVPNISINDITVNEEDGTATLEICLDQTTTVSVTVDYATADASAIDDSDYNNKNATVTIPESENCISVTFDIVDDNDPEDTENFVVNLSNPANGNISDPQGTVNILDTDKEPCTVDAGSMSTDQPTVQLVNGTATITATANGDANIPAGFNQLFVLTKGINLIIINAGPNPSFEVTELGKYTIHSLVYDPNTLDLGIVQFGTTTGFDVNALLIQGGGAICASLDVAGAMVIVQPSISINDITVNEEDGTATLQICLDQTTTVPVTVNYATSNAAAISGIDYEAKSAQATIPAGETCVDVTFVIIDDENPEPKEPFFVNLSAPINANIGNPSGLVTILDTDKEPPVVPNITINDITVNEEDGTATLQICLDQTTTVPVTVNYATSNAAAISGIDYEAKSAQATIPAGETCVDVTFVIVDDNDPEDTESFLVNLSNPTNGNVSDPQGTITILDGDIPCPDADDDGLCDNDDCAPNDANLPTVPGTACNDNNANTINDIIQSDGCTCAGVASPCDLTVTLGDDVTICSGDNVAITAMVDGAAVCTPPDCSNTTLVTYNGSCDDPTECLFPSGIASCLADVSGICPTEGPVNSSCNNNIICIASMFNSWDFTMKANSPFEFKEIEADFWYPTDGSNAGGTANSSSCPTSYDATIKFFVDDVLIATKIVNVEENQILTKTVGPDSPILVETGSTLRVEIGGTPDDEDCDLFELAGLRVNGCCSSQSPMETNTYNWSGPGVNSASAATVVVNKAGTYCVTVTDCSGCTSIDCITVAQPAANLNAEINVINMPSSTSSSNGVLQVAASGGTGPYTFAWSNGQTNSAINGLPSGYYGVTITDNNGCTSSSNATLNARAVIGNRIWNDENQNGIQDTGEEGLAGLPVTINGLQSGGNVYTNSTVSGPDGIYSFDNLDPGNYEIGFTAPQDFIAAPTSAGNDEALDSNADSNTGNTGSISVGFNYVIDDIDAGFHRDCSDLETDFTVSEPICINSMAIFDAFPVGTGASYNWYFFNGTTTSTTYIGSQTGKSVGMSFTSAGQKLVRLNVAFEGCEFSVDHLITVLGNNDPACSSCSNITDGGQIGNDQSGCAPFNPGDLTNITAPSGGNGTIEYRWAASISGTAPQGFDDPNWTVINIADQIIYKPGTINQTTYYIRFSKRSGCEEWTGMSNFVEVEVMGDDITAEFEVLSDPICSGSVLYLAAFDVGTNAAYDWYFFNGPSTNSTFIGGRSGQEVNFTFTSGGEKLVRLSVTNSFGCSAIIDQIITVLAEGDPACANNLVQNNLELRLALNPDDEVMLDWKATNEPGGAIYEVEHSLDGINFDIIGSNDSGSKSGNAMLYEYVDDMVSFGLNYYRVKQVLVDGQFQYSAVKDITIKFTDGNKGIIFPNPAIDLTTLIFSTPLEKQTDFEVVNAQGSIVKRFTMAPGMDRIDLNVSKWQTGYYFIYTTGSGYRQLVNKLLKAN